jgi:hypothetical protein
VYRICGKYIYGIMETRVYFGSVWLKIRTAGQFLVEVFHIEF